MNEQENHNNFYIGERDIIKPMKMYFGYIPTLRSLINLYPRFCFLILGLARQDGTFPRFVTKTADLLFRVVKRLKLEPPIEEEVEIRVIVAEKPIESRSLLADSTKPQPTALLVTEEQRENITNSSDYGYDRVRQLAKSPFSSLSAPGDITHSGKLSYQPFELHFKQYLIQVKNIDKLLKRTQHDPDGTIYRVTQLPKEGEIEKVLQNRDVEYGVVVVIVDGEVYFYISRGESNIKNEEYHVIGLTWVLLSLPEGSEVILLSHSHIKEDGYPSGFDLPMSHPENRHLAKRGLLPKLLVSYGALTGYFFQYGMREKGEDESKNLIMKTWRSDEKLPIIKEISEAPSDIVAFHRSPQMRLLYDAINDEKITKVYIESAQGYWVMWKGDFSPERYLYETIKQLTQVPQFQNELCLFSSSYGV